MRPQVRDPSALNVERIPTKNPLARRGFCLPAGHIRLPFIIFGEVFSEDVTRVRGRFFWDAQKPHVRFVHFAPTFAVIACRTSRNQVRPHMPAAHVARDDMINRQAAFVFAAILAGVSVAPEDFAAR